MTDLLTPSALLEIEERVRGLREAYPPTSPYYLGRYADNFDALFSHISALQEQIERAREPSGKALLAHSGPTIAAALAAAREEGAKEMRERIWDALHETMPPNRVMSLKCDDKIEDGAQIGWMTCNDTFLDIVRELPLPTTPQA